MPSKPATMLIVKSWLNCDCLGVFAVSQSDTLGQAVSQMPADAPIARAGHRLENDASQILRPGAKHAEHLLPFGTCRLQAWEKSRIDRAKVSL